MEKPITIVREELVFKLIELINNTELPAFVIADILKDALGEVQRIAERQLIEDKNTWEKELSNGSN